MSDIVDRLAAEGKDAFAKHYSLGMWKICAEAAEEIASLRARIAELEGKLGDPAVAGQALVNQAPKTGPGPSGFDPYREPFDLIQGAKGRAQFLRDRGEIKTPELIDELLAHIAKLTEALEQLCDDMGPDGLCVCPAAKEQALAALAACESGRSPQGQDNEVGLVHEHTVGEADSPHSLRSSKGPSHG